MMANVAVVCQQQADLRLMQLCRLGPKVGGRLALFCIHRVNGLTHVAMQYISHNVSNINIVVYFLVLLLLTL